MSVEFVSDLPTSGRAGIPRAYLTEEVVAALRANPGQWALIGEQVPFGSTSKFPKQEDRCEFIRRNTHVNVEGQKVCDVYGKWVG